MLPRRLTARVRRGDAGWIAEAPALNALGYGSDPQEALEDLRDSVQQYLEVLRDEAGLAPQVAHHAAYLPLLGAPASSWFASVTVDASDLE